MISLIPISRILKVVAVSYAATVAIAFAMFGDLTDKTFLGWAFAGSAALQLLLLLLLNIGWRAIWWCVPELNRWLFPDLSGTWQVRIIYFFKKQSNEVVATARIKQTFDALSIHLEGVASESDTLAVIPKRDAQGRPYLYYLYRNTPKNTDGEKRNAYEGAATLKLDHDCDHVLEGTYFTEAESHGRFVFTRPARDKKSVKNGRMVSVIIILALLAGAVAFAGYFPPAYWHQNDPSQCSCTDMRKNT